MIHPPQEMYKAALLVQAQSLHIMADTLETQAHCLGTARMDELLTTADLCSEFKISPSKAKEIMRAYGVGKGKIKRISRGEAFMRWRNGDFGRRPIGSIMEGVVD